MAFPDFLFDAEDALKWAANPMPISRTGMQVKFKRLPATQAPLTLTEHRPNTGRTTQSHNIHLGSPMQTPASGRTLPCRMARRFCLAGAVSKHIR